MGEKAIDLNDLRTVEQLAAEHPGVLNVATLRYQVKHREKLGMGRACVRIGRRLLVSKSRYQEWLLGSRTTSAHRGPVADLV